MQRRPVTVFGGKVARIFHDVGVVVTGKVVKRGRGGLVLITTLCCWRTKSGKH